ncbi:uncharacterized protein LOC122527377 [Frieseomelitta varia]|uniref:uncharacterized protein LOC122527377 n=1 Tax=Frieseomelitta varia TaxID=561572 RepID=UPI001CB6AECD|nr:uncharacterized protein LOC122527377 [Frieseomelitta varia]
MVENASFSLTDRSIVSRRSRWKDEERSGGTSESRERRERERQLRDWVNERVRAKGILHDKIRIKGKTDIKDLLGPAKSLEGTKVLPEDHKCHSGSKDSEVNWILSNASTVTVGVVVLLRLPQGKLRFASQFKRPVVNFICHNESVNSDEVHQSTCIGQGWSVTSRKSICERDTD